MRDVCDCDELEKKNECSTRFLAVVWNIFCSNLIHVWFWWANFISPECNERIDESTAYLRLNTKLIFPVEWLCPLFVPSSVAIRNALAKRIQLYKIIDIILCVCVFLPFQSPIIFNSMSFSYVQFTDQSWRYFCLRALFLSIPRSLWVRLMQPQ